MTNRTHHTCVCTTNPQYHLILRWSYKEYPECLWVKWRLYVSYMQLLILNKTGHISLKKIRMNPISQSYSNKQRFVTAPHLLAFLLTVDFIVQRLFLHVNNKFILLKNMLAIKQPSMSRNFTKLHIAVLMKWWALFWKSMRKTSQMLMPLSLQWMTSIQFLWFLVPVILLDILNLLFLFG